MVWCDYCKDERFYALIKEIKEDIKHKKKLLLKQKFRNKAFHKEFRDFLKIEIAALESVLNMAKNVTLATLTQKELEKLEKKGKLFGI